MFGLPIPDWIIKIFVDMAISLGLPWVLGVIKKIFPTLPVDVITAIEDLIRKILEHKETVQVSKRQIQEAKRQARACVGQFCANDIKRD